MALGTDRGVTWEEPREDAGLRQLLRWGDPGLSGRRVYLGFGSRFLYIFFVLDCVPKSIQGP